MFQCVNRLQIIRLFQSHKLGNRSRNYILTVHNPFPASYYYILGKSVIRRVPNVKSRLSRSPNSINFDTTSEDDGQICRLFVNIYLAFILLIVPISPCKSFQTVSIIISVEEMVFASQLTIRCLSRSFFSLLYECFI